MTMSGSQRPGPGLGRRSCCAQPVGCVARCSARPSSVLAGIWTARVLAAGWAREPMAGANRRTSWATPGDVQPWFWQVSGSWGDAGLLPAMTGFHL